MNSLRLFSIAHTQIAKQLVNSKYDKIMVLLASNIYRRINYVQSCVATNKKCLHTMKATNADLQTSVSAGIFKGSIGNNNNNRRVERALQLLDSDVHKLNRVFRADIEQLLNFQGISEPRYGVLLLQCCGNLLPDETPASRMQLLQRIWKTLQEMNVTFTVEHYNSLLASYAENGHKISVSEFISNMHGVKPNETTYHLLLWCVCETGDIDQAVEVIALMKAQGFPATEHVFNSLILGHARRGDMDSALNILEMMENAKVLPTNNTYTALLQGFAEQGNGKKLTAVYKEALSKNITLNVKQIMKIVKSLTTSGHQDYIPEVLKWLPEITMELSGTISSMATCLVHLGYDEAACSLLKVLPMVPASDMEVTPMFGTFLIREMVKANRPVSKITELCESLMSDNRNPVALEKATETALGVGNIDMALSLFGVLKEHGRPIRPHYFWPLFITVGKQFGEKGILKILNHMKEFDVQPDFDTLVDYILPQISLVDPKLTLRVLQDQGFHISKLLTPVLAVLLKAGRNNEVLQLCSEFNGKLQPERLLEPAVISYVSTRDSVLVASVLQHMTSDSSTANDWAGQFLLNILSHKRMRISDEQLSDLLQKFSRFDLKISTLAADMLLQHFNERLDKRVNTKLKNLINNLISPDLNLLTSEYVHFIPKPSELNLEELECHLVELRAKGMNRRGVLRKLLQEYSRQGNLSKLLETKREFEQAGYEYSLGMIASLFYTMVQLGALEEAENYFNRLQKVSESFVMDEYKIIDYATLLVKNNNIKDAVTVLEENARNNKIKGGPAIAHNCHRLLNSIAEKGDAAETRHVLELLSKLGYCSISNKLLGPLIRAHFIRDDLDSAVEEFQKCVEEFKATPLQHELLCKLVVKAVNEKSASEQLQRVVDLCTKVHGSESTEVAVAVSLAEMGLTKQLKRHLMATKGKLRCDLLMERCRRLSDEQKAEALQNLASAAQGIAFFPLDTIYTLILKVYSRNGDCDAALALWTSLQELDIQPEAEFMSILQELLISHKRKVPFHV